MNTRFLISIILILAFQLCNAQQKSIPKNLKQAATALQSDCPDSLKTLIKKTNDDKLVEISYPWGGQYKTISNWLSDENKEIKISKYLINKRITYIPHQESVILIAFKQKMLNQAFNERGILKPYQLIELKWSKEDKVRLTTDSLRGFYIPKDLEDCFKQMDKFWNDSTKKQVKSWTENEFTGKAHLGFGMWMRNNWQLWGGSRLFAYFNNMGISNPEDMSGIILVSYHRYLLGQPIKLKEQIKFYEDYWKKARKEDTLNKLKEFAEYKVGDTIVYKYRFDYTSKKQEDDSDNDLCKANGIVTAKNDTTFQLDVKIIETCEKKGIIIYDSKDSFVYDSALKKWVKPKKRKIVKAYKNDIKWFNYDFWEIKE